MVNDETGGDLNKLLTELIKVRQIYQGVFRGCWMRSSSARACLYQLGNIYSTFCIDGMCDLSINLYKKQNKSLHLTIQLVYLYNIYMKRNLVCCIFFVLSEQ